MPTENQMNELQVSIRQHIAESDPAEIEHDAEGYCVLTNKAVDSLAATACSAVEHFMESIPVDLLLFCPNPRCGKQHIDQPQPEKNWNNPPHRSHECQFCGIVWRPSDFPTNGVASIRTRGSRDSFFFNCNYLTEDSLSDSPLNKQKVLKGGYDY